MLALPGEPYEICYLPSNNDGKTCERNSDCGKGKCYIGGKYDEPVCSDIIKDLEMHWNNQEDIDTTNNPLSYPTEIY